MAEVEEKGDGYLVDTWWRRQTDVELEREHKVGEAAREAEEARRGKRSRMG